MLRRTPLVRTTVEISPGRRAAVEVVPAPGRWPRRESEDRLVVPLGVAALALARSEAAAFESIRNRVQASAASVASTDPLEVDWPAWSFAVAGLQVIDAEGPGGPRIEVQS